MLVRCIKGEWFEKTKNMFENILEKNKKHKIHRDCMLTMRQDRKGEQSTCLFPFRFPTWEMTVKNQEVCQNRSRGHSLDLSPVRF